MKRNVRVQGSLLAVIFLCTAGAALAQRKGGGAMDPDQMADRQVAAMKERLKLTDDQAAKVKPILVDSTKKQMEIRQKYNVQQGQRPSDEAMADMKKAREDTNKKLSEVLSKEQMQEYTKMQSEMRGRAGAGGGGKKQ